jgi:hypothetical protein
MHKDLAPGVFRPDRRDSASMFFHAGHPVPRDFLAPYCLFRKLISA